MPRTSFHSTLTLRRAPLINLADDPGSAILTVACAGMVDLSAVGPTSPRRTVAFYKNPYTGIREIDLPNDASVILLTLSPQG